MSNVGYVLWNIIVSTIDSSLQARSEGSAVRSSHFQSFRPTLPYGEWACLPSLKWEIISLRPSLNELWWVGCPTGTKVQSSHCLLLPHLFLGLKRSKNFFQNFQTPSWYPPGCWSLSLYKKINFVVQTCAIAHFFISLSRATFKKTP